MKAYRLNAWQTEPELTSVPDLEPGPGEVVIKVGGAGACHSDIHLMEWPEGTMDFRLPFTIGHENAGWVEATGEGVSGLERGDAVAVYGPWGCGTCRACRGSSENYCEKQATLGYLGGGLGRDGGMAEYMLVPDERLLIPLGDLDPRVAAPLTDAGLTPYHAVARSRDRLFPGSTAVVIGVGGLGHMAVQIIKAIAPATVIALDLDRDKLALATEVGADEALLPGEAAVMAIRDRTGGLGAELVIDMVGSDETLGLAAQIAGMRSHLTVVGLAGGTLPFAFGALPFECSVALPYWGSAIELMEVLELARQGRIAAHTHRFGLDEAPRAYEQLREGKLTGRAVICPND